MEARIMSQQGYAFFVRRPRRIDDLWRLHLIDQEAKYEVVKTIILPKIDFENFATDMLADRVFLEGYAHLCDRSGPVIRCLLVRTRRSDLGILVYPDGAWVDIAAIAKVK